MGKRLDSYGTYPSGMQEYLSLYGWHFSKKMYTWAVSLLKKINPNTGQEQPLDICKKEQADELAKKYNINSSKFGYDYYYVINEKKAVYWKDSITDEQCFAKCVKSYLDSGYSEMPFTRFYADCIAKGIPIIWEDMI